MVSIAIGSAPIARHERIRGRFFSKPDKRHRRTWWLGVRDRAGLGLFYDLSPIPIFGCVNRARRRPSYDLPSVPFAHLCGAWPEQASLLVAFLLNLPPLWRAARAGQLIVALLLHIVRGLSGPAYHCLAAPNSAWPKRASLSSSCCST